jgi:hypothetical protein
LGAGIRKAERMNVDDGHVRGTVAALARIQMQASRSMTPRSRDPLINAVLVRGPSRIYLNAAERSKGAAGVCCRQLDGRAAILMVVARPGGCELAGSFCGSSARWPFTCLDAVPPAVGQGAKNTSRRVARISLRSPLALTFILPAVRIAGHLATPSMRS